MRTADTWFAADTKGLAQLVAGKPKSALVRELLQNALDEDCTRIDITLEPVPGRPLARLVVEDDSPGGFADLRHAYTLFAETGKRADPEKRGRFTLGEKLALACTVESRVVTTTGTVEFSRNGKRHEHTREKTETGSRFEGLVRMTREEYEQALVEIPWVILPSHVEVYFNGARLEPRTPLVRFEETLRTVIAAAEGVLRQTRRKTTVEVYEPLPGEPAMIFEMGIPVVATGDRFAVNVLQRVPLNTDRDNVPPAFLRAVRVSVLNHTVHLLKKDETTAAWVDQVLREKNISEDAVRTVVRERFGEKVVAADPSDPEAMNRAASHGYTVLSGGTLDGAQWANVRRVGAAPAAGRVFPTPKPYSTDPSAPPVKVIPESEWTPAIRDVVAFTCRLARRLIGGDIAVRVVHTTNAFAACYGSRSLDLNLMRLGHAFFDEWQSKAGMQRLLDLLLDELAHDWTDNHLSEKYYRALRTLGSTLTVLALHEPALFRALGKAR